MSNDDVTPGTGEPEQPGGEPTPQPPQPAAPPPSYGAPPPAAPEPPPAAPSYGTPPPAAPGYGTPPPAAPGYGTPPPAAPAYGAPAPGYGTTPPAAPYGGAGYSPGAYAGTGGVPNLPYIPWGTRALGYIVDYLVVGIPATIGWIIFFAAGSKAAPSYSVDPTTGQITTTAGSAGIGAGLAFFALLLYAATIGLWVWNRCIRAGRTGQSVGKSVMKTKLVSAETGQPIGAGMAFVRDLCHILDSLACYIGWLFPLWDAQRQTFADKIIKTYVLPENFNG